MPLNCRPNNGRRKAPSPILIKYLPHSRMAASFLLTQVSMANAPTRTIRTCGLRLQNVCGSESEGEKKTGSRIKQTNPEALRRIRIHVYRRGQRQTARAISPRRCRLYPKRYRIEMEGYGGLQREPTEV
jgi:hypothetical protein